MRSVKPRQACCPFLTPTIHFRVKNLEAHPTDDSEHSAGIELFDRRVVHQKVIEHPVVTFIFKNI